jgi:hypothetical protein
MISTAGYEKLVKCPKGENLHWTTDPNTELPIKMAQTGMAAEIKP